jgi:signal transduction histidine kinase
LLFPLALLGALALLPRADPEAATRNELASWAREAAGRLDTAAARLLAVASSRGPGVAHWKNGRFVSPPEPQKLAGLELPRGRDPEGEFYLAEADRAETRDADPDRARGLYRAAAAPDRDPACRSLALFRHAALERRAGRSDDAAKLDAAFLEALPADDRATREALVIRSLARPADDAFAADLLAHLAGGSDEVVRGLAAAAGLPGEMLRRREEEVRRIERLRPMVPAADAPATGARVGHGLLCAWARTDDGTFLAEGDLPALPPRVQVIAVGATLDEREQVAERAPVSLIPDVQAAAAVPRREIAARATRERRTTLMLGALLLVGGGAALLLTQRAVRRELAATAARAHFIARVGHDLRTPLTLIRMYAETLAEGRVSDPAEARAFAGVAAREAGRLSRLAENVLDFSRAGARAAERRPVDLARLAREVVDAWRPLLEEAGVRASVTAGPATVRGDEEALRGALGNLLDNARGHAASGGVVEVAVQARDGRAEVHVRDRGPGVPAGMEERLFERFVRGPDARPRGAGLGLALVREVAAAHGGAARVGPREGGGADFTVELPLAEDGVA